MITREEDKLYNIEHARMLPKNGFANVEVMISHRFYTTKWDFARFSNSDFTVKSDVVTKNGNVDAKDAKTKSYLKDIDVEKDLLKSHKSKTMLSLNKEDLDKLEPRQNAYFNLAFGWERTFYYYNDVSARFHDI